MKTHNFGIYPSLSEKTIFVTGGASGIGAEIVRAFFAQGAHIGIVDIDAEAGRKLATELGEKVVFEQCDLRNIDSLRSTFSALIKQLGPASVLVNNAGQDDRHNWENVTADYYDDRIAVNLKHQFFAIQAVAPGMIALGGGVIINIGSSSWLETGGGLPIYALAKAGVHGMTRTLARDLGQHRIRLNTVVPSWTMTDRQKKLWVTPEALEKQRERQCLPDLIEPVYIARMVLFLASDDAAMCTANNFIVDAGSI